MKNLLLLTALFLTLGTASAKNLVTTDVDVIGGINGIVTMDIVAVRNNVAIINASNEAMREITELTHEKFGRCGGFFYHKTVEQAMKSLSVTNTKSTAPRRDYSLTKASDVEKALDLIEEGRIAKFIKHLSSYKNRYYQSETGQKAALSIRDKWKDLLKETPNSKVELYKHEWRQPSVIATIIGSKYPDEVIVVGGHLDSIAGWFDRTNATAPGADDNASGIATVTETIRVLVASGFAPQKTVKFMGYAAEEVGLRGSAEIAKEFKTNKVNVIGAMQLDMTNFRGSEKDIYIITDYTNKNQNEFLKKLITKYVKVSFQEDKCGYACSDHASWHKNGFAASMPFESSKNGMNSKIHTSGDLIEVSGDNALHAVNFAKLATAYVIELSK
jgi:leucyl aminopeptidase